MAVLAGFVLGLLAAAVAGIVHLWRLGAELVGPEGDCRAARRIKTLLKNGSQI